MLDEVSASSQHRGAEAADPGQANSGLNAEEPWTASQVGGSMSVHELKRVQKMHEQNAQAVESRIKFFRREEEKIWRDLEEVRRQAAKIEEGRTRALEKRLANKAVSESRQQAAVHNQVRVAKARQERQIRRQAETAAATLSERRAAGEKQRRESDEILRRKRLEEAQDRLAKSERVVDMQREQLEAKLKANQERAERLAKLRESNELARQAAERDVAEVERRLPELEAQEMICLERLQNSRIVTQTVLQDLEASLGSQSPVTTLLRNKQQRSSSVLLAEGGGDNAASPIGGSGYGGRGQSGDVKAPPGS